jgi:SET domain-containing protein
MTTTWGGRVVERPSAIHGRGAYAATDIPAGEVVVEYLGERIGRAEAVARDDPASPRFSPYILEVSEDLYLDGATGGNEARFVNHACEPNCRVRVVGERAFFVAARDIAAGEELTIDYAFDPPASVPCRCGTPACRGSL